MGTARTLFALDEYEDADIDYKLAYRWDAHWNEPAGTANITISMIQQRRGTCLNINIESCSDEEAVKFMEFLEPYKLYSKRLWDDETVTYRIQDQDQVFHKAKVLSIDMNRAVVEMVDSSDGFEYGNGKTISPVIVFNNDNTTALKSTCGEYTLLIEELI